MNDQENRLDLHRRIEILKLYLNNGKVKFAPDLIKGFHDSISKLVYGQDGIILTQSVDGRIRALSSLIADQENRREWKDAVPLKDIQCSYFRMVEYAFGEIYSDLFLEAKRRIPDTDAAQFSHWFVSNGEHVKKNIEIVIEFMENIKNFWKELSDPIWIHTEDQDALKAVFGGETFPIDRHNIASSCGLYIDTIYLPCPFTKIFELFDKLWSNEEKVREVLSRALNLLKYRELVLNDLSMPIVVILPDRRPFDPEYSEFVAELGRYDAIKHAEVVFGESFESNEDVRDFSRNINDMDGLIKKIKNPDRLLFDTEWNNLSFSDKIERFLNDPTHSLNIDYSSIVHSQSFMRMSQANDLLVRSRQVGGVPLIEAPTSWKYFNWKLEYDLKALDRDQLSNLHVVRGLQSMAEGEMQWLGNIPPEALLEMRKLGAVDELREVLSGGISEIASANPTNFWRTGDRVFDNIQNAFKEHEKKIQEIGRKKWKFAGHDIGAFVVSGTLEIGAALTGNPMFGLSVVGVNQVLDIPKLREFPKIAKELLEESKSIKSSPVGLLFKQKK